MKYFAIGDLHMPGTIGKSMDVFGDHWRDHLDRIAVDWDSRVDESDLVLIPGDISWAPRLIEAELDLAWIGARAGMKILIRGNHDSWWQSIGKVRSALPQRCHAIQNDAWVSGDGTIAVAGSRMWDLPELSLGDIFAAPLERETPAKDRIVDPDRQAKIFHRELARLEMSLQKMPDTADERIVMVHYPPTDPALRDTVVTRLLERYGVTMCLFGHLHNVRSGIVFGGVKNGVRYELTSADFLDFRLLELK